MPARVCPLFGLRGNLLKQNIKRKLIKLQYKYFFVYLPYS